VNNRNEFLLKIGTESRKTRVSFWSDTDTVSVRITDTPNWKDAGLWFRTAGCTYDTHGGCIMCDYSNGPKTTVEQMISYVKQGFKQIPSDCRVLLVSPSGSMLDDKEVPREALTGILNALRESPFQRITFETRAETITDEAVKLCMDILGSRFWGLYVGLESASPFILKHCINKQLQLSAVEDAILVCTANNVRITFNVLVGAPFLSADESVKSAIDTVKWALSKGVFRCDLFPIHVKYSTPLAALYEEGFYSPPSLWELVDVLNGLEEELLPQIGLSWYTTNGAYNIISSPTTCPECAKEVVTFLTGFANTQKPSFIHQMNNMVCACKKTWGNDAVIDSLPNRVFKGYKVLANRFLGDYWWSEHADSINSMIQSDWVNGGETIAF
jgi:hypothetical protein